MENVLLCVYQYIHYFVMDVIARQLPTALFLAILQILQCKLIGALLALEALGVERICPVNYQILYHLQQHLLLYRDHIPVVLLAKVHQ